MNLHKSNHYICSVDNCFDKHYAFGLCVKHWRLLKFKEKQDNSLWDEFREVDIEKILSLAYQSLKGRQKKVIKLRWILDYKYQEIANMFNISRARVQQIEMEALKRMRKRIFKFKKELF